MTGGGTGSTEGPTGVRLGGYAFLILFFELALIRYVPGHVRVFGFYLNFVLLSAFLGMGTGLLRAEHVVRVRWVAPAALLALFAAVKILADVQVQAPVDPNEQLWGVFFDTSPSVRRLGVVPVVILLFALCTLVFLPLGAFFGREFQKFSPLRAYSIDITGSLLGVVTFGLASASGLPPLAWFAIALVVWLALSIGDRRFLMALGPASALTLGLVAWTSGRGVAYWSPYYRISVSSLIPESFTIDVNGSFHQFMLNLDTSAARRIPIIAALRADYLRPHRLLARADTALVLGAGTGNDVALLLERGAGYVDAVEIDPTIAALGRAGHPQHPYADPRVRLHVDDARAFLRRTSRRYDLIVLGTLDSQTLLSAMSSLRLDNYVYTLEAFRAARDRLKPGGRLVTYHMSPQPYIAAKIHGVLTAVFGSEPVVLHEPAFRLFNYTFVAGEGLPPNAGTGLPPDARMDVSLPRDDWPYLYLLRRTIPAHYLWALGGVLAVTLAVVGWGAGRALRSGFDGAMFFMGLGFMLLETKSVTEMSLLFGSTWVVNLLVFSAVLLVILVANGLVLRRPAIGLGWPFAALFAALALAYAVPVRDLLWLGNLGQWILGGALVALPIMCAATIFAALFSGRAAPTRALAFNLIGAMVGGVLEYASLVVGIKGLHVVAAAAYLAAFVFARRGGSLRVARAS